MLPPTCTSRPAAQDVRRQRRRRRFAVGSGDGDEGHLKGLLAPLAREKLQVADHLDAPRASPCRTAQCGSGCVSGMPGASTSAENVAQFDVLDDPRLECRRQPRRSRSRRCRRWRPRRPPPAISALAVAMPEAPRPKTATDFPANVVMRIMGESNAVRPVPAPQRSFSVARPTSASTTEMIQKRTTTVDSCQPCCS